MSKDENKRSAATRIMEDLVQGNVRLFHGEDDTVFAVLPVGTTRQVWPLDSKEVAAWLAMKYYRAYGKVPGGQAIRDTVKTMEGIGKHGSTREKVWLRTAERDGVLYLDLSNEAWEAVAIKGGSWEVIPRPPVWFKRTAGMKELPRPERDGDIGLLRRFLNIGGDQEWILVRAWLTAALRPVWPYPILVLSGQQGSAKSTNATFLRMLIDPSLAMIRQEPKSRQDLIVAGDNSWVLAFDNLSYLTAEMSDAMCCIATGTGFTCRALFTDRTEAIFQFCRPIITTSIEDIASRSDVCERSILIHCPIITGDTRRSYQAIKKAYEQELPLILGGALNLLAKAQRRFRYVKETGLPRMGDFARWGIAVEQALGEPEGSFLEAYNSNLVVGKANAIESSPLVPALLALVEKWPEWEGSASRLLADLKDCAFGLMQAKDWPKVPSQLSNRLRRLAPNLPAVGIKAEVRTVDGYKIWRIVRTEGESIATAVTPENPFA